MKRELSTDREAADEKLAKKIRLDRSMVFKKETHEKQFCFNKDVREKISHYSCLTTPWRVKCCVVHEGLKWEILVSLVSDNEYLTACVHFPLFPCSMFITCDSYCFVSFCSSGWRDCPHGRQWQRTYCCGTVAPLQWGPGGRAGQ